MKKHIKKVISLVLALATLMSIIPTMAMAARDPRVEAMKRVTIVINGMTGYDGVTLSEEDVESLGADGQLMVFLADDLDGKGNAGAMAVGPDKKGNTTAAMWSLPYGKGEMMELFKSMMHAWEAFTASVELPDGEMTLVFISDQLDGEVIEVSTVEQAQMLAELLGEPGELPDPEAEPTPKPTKQPKKESTARVVPNLKAYANGEISEEYMQFDNIPEYKHGIWLHDGFGNDGYANLFAQDYIKLLTSKYNFTYLNKVNLNGIFLRYHLRYDGPGAPATINYDNVDCHLVVEVNLRDWQVNLIMAEGMEYRETDDRTTVSLY